MKKVLKFLIVFILTFSIQIAIFILWYALDGRYIYESPYEYVKTNSECNEIYDSRFEKEVFLYENDDNVIYLYNSPSNEFFTYIFDVKEKDGKKYYSLNYGGTMLPITWNKEWEEVDKNLKYIFVDYQDDIKDIDCMGYEPEGTKIYYKLEDGKEESCWIYIIDKSQNGD